MIATESNHPMLDFVFFKETIGQTERERSLMGFWLFFFVVVVWFLFCLFCFVGTISYLLRLKLPYV